MLYINSNKIAGVYAGSSKIKEIYIGQALLYSAALGLKYTKRQRSDGPGYYYSLDGLGTLTVNDLKDKYNKVVLNVAATHNELNVEEIGERAFEGVALQMVSISQNIKKINRYAFRNCALLYQINFGATNCQNGSWTSNEQYAFHNAGSNSSSGLGVYIENNVNVVPGSIFCNNHYINNVQLNTTQIIKRNAFSGCTALTEITIDKGVTDIGARAFNTCSTVDYNGTALQFINLLKKNGLQGNLTDNIFAQNATIRLSEVNYNSYGYNAAANNSGVLLYPHIDYTAGTENKYTHIPANAFNNDTTIERLVISSGITEIKSGAFTGLTNLKEVHIPLSLLDTSVRPFKSRIADGAFGGFENDMRKITVYFEGTLEQWNALSKKNSTGAYGIGMPASTTTVYYPQPAYEYILE